MANSRSKLKRKLKPQSVKIKLRTHFSQRISWINKAVNWVIVSLLWQRTNYTMLVLWSTTAQIKTDFWLSDGDKFMKKSTEISN